MPEPSLDLSDDELADLLEVVEHAVLLARIMTNMMEELPVSDPKLAAVLIDVLEKSEHLSPRLVAVLKRRRGPNVRLH